MEDQELFGANSSSTAAADRVECLQLCQSTVGCWAVTYSGGTCYSRTGPHDDELAATLAGASMMRMCTVLETPALHEAYNFGAKRSLTASLHVSTSGASATLTKGSPVRLRHRFWYYCKIFVRCSRIPMVSLSGTERQWPLMCCTICEPDTERTYSQMLHRCTEHL